MEPTGQRGRSQPCWHTCLGFAGTGGDNSHAAILQTFISTPASAATLLCSRLGVNCAIPPRLLTERHTELPSSLARGWFHYHFLYVSFKSPIIPHD